MRGTLLLCCSLLAALAYASVGTAQDEHGGVAVESVVLRLLHEANAPAQRAGVLTKLLAKEGDRVTRGQTLAEMDPREAAIAAKSAEIELAIASERATNDVQVRYAAKANEVAAAELRRSQESIKSFPKSVSRSQLDVEQLEVEKTALEREQAEQDQKLAGLEARLKQAAVDAAQLELSLRTIAAPLDGVVVEAPAKLGEWLEPGQLAFRLVNVDRLKAEGFVAAGEAPRVRPGATARLRIDGRDRVYNGRVVFVSPEIDPINNQVRVWAEIDNQDQQLRPGEHAEMRIETAAP